MVRPTYAAWRKRLILAAGAAACFGVAMAAKPANAQISIQLPFVSLGVGYPYYYPYYGYPYYYRAHYWGWRRCHWWHHRCHYY
jgi:hypothetical protein